MQLTESSIYVNMKRLREMLYMAQFQMTKADRIIYGTPIIQASGEALGAFVLAFMIKEDKLKYMDQCIGWFTRLRVDLEFCVRQNIIKFKSAKAKQAAPGEAEKDAVLRDEVSPQKVEMFRLVAEVDSDMCKWRAAIQRGKTLHE